MGASWSLTTTVNKINREADFEISSLMRFKDGIEQDTKYKREKIKLGKEGGDT